MTMPIISVIMPVYNVEKFIQKSIVSLLNQTFLKFEVLVVDDGSEDESIKIAKRAAGSDRRFIFLTKKNGGLSAARNYGIDKASGKYLSFLDSDDYFDKSFLEKMYSKIIQDNSDICVCDVTLVKENGDFIRYQKVKYKRAISGFDAFLDNIQTVSIISMAQNKLYKKKIFDGDNKYPEGLYYEDRATTYKLFFNSKRICFVNEPLFFYVQRKGSIMNGIDQKKIDDRFIVINSIKKYLKGKNIFHQYKKEFIICYLLNVVLSGSVQIAAYSKKPRKELLSYKARFNKKYFTYKAIFLLKKTSTKKMLILILLKLSYRIFIYYASKEKKKIF